MLTIDIRDDDRSQIIEIVDTTTIVGRSSKCDLRLKSDVLSGQHALISYFGDSATVQDLGSSNGLYVDAKTVTHQSPVPIGMHSTIELGAGGPLLTVINGPVLTKPDGKAGYSTSVLLAAVAFLTLCLCCCIVGLVITGGAVLFENTSYFGSAITQIEENHDSLEQAVGRVQLGFELEASDGQTMVVQQSHGTGFVVTQDGYVFTNRHVIENAQTFKKSGYISMSAKHAFSHGLIDEADLKNVQEVKVDKATLGSKVFKRPVQDLVVWVIFGNVAHEAKIIHVSEDFDFAILKVGLEENPHFRIANKNEIESAEDIFAIGYPSIASLPMSKGSKLEDYLRNKTEQSDIVETFRQEQLEFSITKGIVNRMKVEDNPRRYWVQHDAFIHRGNSGGPLCTPSGVVVGLNTMMTDGGVGLGTTYFSIATKQLEKEIQQHVPDIEWESPK